MKQFQTLDFEISLVGSWKIQFRRIVEGGNMQMSGICVWGLEIPFQKVYATFREIANKSRPTKISPSSGSSGGAIYRRPLRNSLTAPIGEKKKTHNVGRADVFGNGINPSSVGVACPFVNDDW